MHYTLYLKSHFKKYKKERIPLIAFDTNDPKNIYWYFLSDTQIDCEKHQGFWDVDWEKIKQLRDAIAEEIKNWDKWSLCDSFEEWFEKQTPLRNDFEWEKGI